MGYGRDSAFQVSGHIPLVYRGKLAVKPVVSYPEPSEQVWPGQLLCPPARR